MFFKNHIIATIGVKNMSRNKNIAPFAPYERSAEVSNGKESRYIRLVHLQLICMKNLSGNAFKLYVMMKDYAKGNEEFEFPHRIYKELFSNQTFSTARDELIEKGFLKDFVSQAPRKQPNIYRFSGEWRNVFSEQIKRETSPPRK